MSKDRRDKINYYLDLAEVVAQRGTCLRRNYGAVIVKNDEVISSGYVGAPREKSGSWFSYNDAKLAQGREAAKKVMQDNPELADEIEARIRAALKSVQD